MKNLNKDTVIITTRRNKMEILQLKSMTEIKISLARLNITCEMSEEIISELEDKLIQYQSEKPKRKMNRSSENYAEPASI